MKTHDMYIPLNRRLESISVKRDLDHLSPLISSKFKIGDIVSFSYPYFGKSRNSGEIIRVHACLDKRIILEVAYYSPCMCLSKRLFDPYQSLSLPRIWEVEECNHPPLSASRGFNENELELATDLEKKELLSFPNICSWRHAPTKFGVCND